MSSKSSSDKVEPIKLDTTILKIDIKTNGDLITKEFDLIPFHPNMSDMKDLSNNNYILFPSFVKVTMKYLKNAGVGQDYMKVFTNLEKYIQLIKFLTHPNKEIDEDFTLLVDQTQYKDYALSFVQDFTSDITQDFRAVQKYEPLTDNEIITNNIGIIKSIFLPVNGRFFVLGHEYIINQSKYLPPYKSSTALNEKLTVRKDVPLNYSITVELQLLDVIKNPGMGDFGKLSCQQKKINLNKDAKEIFGDTFGYKEEVKAVLPPLTPTTTSKRSFGKLQLEWEERNKYVKAPTTETERLAIESKWTPLQKKLAQYDKYQEEYNKIPPLWIKERNDLDAKYTAFEKAIEGYKKEIADIKNVNKDYNETTKEPTFVNDLISTVEVKIRNALDQFYREGDDKPSLEKLLLESKENIFEKDTNKSYKNTSLKKIYEKEKEMMNNKYAEPFLVDMEERTKDVEVLKGENDKINKEIKELQAKGDIYSIKPKEQQRAKVQANLLKKQTDLKMLEDKLGKNGVKLVQKWEDSLRKVESLKTNIESDKEVGEKTILNESVKKELESKLSEIKKIKEKLNKANYFEGNYLEISKEEIDSYSKKPGDRPIESVSLLESSLTTLQDEYLEIANKLGMVNQVQGWITLLNDNLMRIIKLRDLIKDRNKKKDKEIQEISTELKNLKTTNNSSVPNPRIKQVEANQLVKSTDLGKLTAMFNAFVAYEKAYNAEITRLKQLKKEQITTTTITDSKSIVNEIKEKFFKDMENYKTPIEGGSSRKITRRLFRHKRKHKKTKREKIKALYRSLKKRLRRKRKDRKTRRH